MSTLEIFCGTGGVGKTTTATSRALFHSLKNKKVLLITIDPSQRLKQVLNLSDQKAGTIEQVNFQYEDKKIQLDALLMSAPITFERIAACQGSSLQNNRILNILMRPNGGLNEIMSVVEVKHQLEKKVYDTIVLDTPPGEHFLDFLEAAKKLDAFFNNAFIETFSKLQSSQATSTFSKIFEDVTLSGLKKLLSLLEIVTGGSFVEEFIETIHLFYRAKSEFLGALNFPTDDENEVIDWYLVTSVEQQKIIEAKELKQKVKNLLRQPMTLILNKSLYQPLKSWTPQQNSPLNDLKNSLQAKEQKSRDFAIESFESLITFPEVFSHDPFIQMRELISHWESS